MQGKITISEAAHKAEITIFDMEQYLLEQGYIIQSRILKRK